MPFFYLLGKPPVATIVFCISAISLFTTAGPLLGDFVNPWTFAIFEALHCFVYLLFCEGNGHEVLGQEAYVDDIVKKRNLT